MREDFKEICFGIVYGIDWIYPWLNPEIDYFF